MERNRLQKIYDAFAASGKFISAIPMAGGNTYHVITDEEAGYTLHRVRSGLFSNISDMIRNKEMVAGHVRNKLIKQNIRDITRKYLTYFHTHRQQPYYKDHEGNYWTLSLFIKDTRTHDSITTPALAREIGTGLGEFEQRTQDFDPGLLAESIPCYQDVARWTSRLRHAIEKANDERREACSDCVSQLSSFDKEARARQEALDAAQLPVRVTHNAFNSACVLLDWNDKPICVINLDMVMPGIIHHDFGDAVRSVCDTGNGTFNETLFHAFIDGFYKRTGQLLSRKEKETLHLACELMPYLQATRHLVRFLDEGDSDSLRQARAHVSFLRAIADARHVTRASIKQ